MLIFFIFKFRRESLFLLFKKKQIYYYDYDILRKIFPMNRISFEEIDFIEEITRIAADHLNIKPAIFA